MNSTLNIRSLHTMEEMKQVQILEDIVWTGGFHPYSPNNYGCEKWWISYLVLILKIN